jgi:hypothetical protein
VGKEAAALDGACMLLISLLSSRGVLGFRDGVDGESWWNSEAHGKSKIHDVRRCP